MTQQINAVQRMQDYINNHLWENITLMDLAKESYYSLWYSLRLFKDYLGQTPAEYIRKLRLTESAKRLKNDKCHITDVAFDCGFDSVDGYTRAFKKEFGCKPGQYVKKPVPITLFIPYGIKFRHYRKKVCNMENLQSIFVSLQHKPAHKVIIKRGIKADNYWDYCMEVGCDVWGILSSMDSLANEPVCLWLNEKYKKPNTSTYVQGVEVPLDYNGIIPNGFDIIEFFDSDYLVFQGEPFKEEDYEEAMIALIKAINNYDPSVLGYKWDNENPRIQLEPRGERGYIELRPITKL